MQTTSSQFNSAVVNGARVLADPKLMVDWGQDGFEDIQTTHFQDTFNRVVTDSGRFWGWTNPPVQYAWNVFATTGNVPTDWQIPTPGNAQMRVDGGGRYRGAYVNNLAVRDYLIYGRVGIGLTTLPTGGYVEAANIVGRLTLPASNNNYYLYRVAVWTTGQLAIWIFDPLGNQLAFASPQRYWIPGRDICILAGAMGNTHYIKGWVDGDPVPVGWDLKLTDNTQLEAGFIGARSGIALANTNGAITFSWKTFVNCGFEDMSHQLTDGWSVGHALDDGMPDDVSNGVGQGNFGQVQGDLAGRRGRYAQGGPESAGRYFSPFNRDSPVAPYDRDVAPITLDAGLVTTNGQERVRLFTGQMSDIATQGDLASLTAVSASNRKLQKLIQPPPIIASAAGLTGSWPVSYALSQCGLYVSPPPRSSGCMMWAPMHGSMQPMVGGIYRSSHPHDQLFTTSHQYAADTFIRTDRSVSFVDGPYLEGTWAEVNAGHKQWNTMQGIALEYTNNANIFCQQGNKGRFEFWVRTDTATDASNPPGGTGSIPGLVYLNLHQFYNGKTLDIKCGINRSFQVFFTINDGTNTQTMSKATPVPQDGQWHFVGIAWDMSANTVWEEFDNVTVSTFTGSPAITTANLPPFDIMDQDSPQVYPLVQWFVPVAEMQITSGTNALPTNSPWANDPTYWDPSQAGVVMTPSVNRQLVALAETQPVRAIDLINRFAKAELAMTRCDEQDRFNYLPMPYWAKTAQQTVVDTYTSTTNIIDMKASRDITRVRNSVSLGYKATGVSNLTNVYTDNILRFIPPGETIFRINFQDPVVYVNASGGFIAWDATPLSDPLPLQCFISLNTAPDGTGNAWSTSLFVTIDSWDPGGLTLRIDSLNLGPLWMVRADGGPVLGIAGRKVSSSDGVATAVNSPSVKYRGERGLSVAYNDIQDPTFAQTMATELASRLAWPRWRVDDMELVGDHRRQPGDLVTVRDKDGTALDGPGRVMSISHQQSGASFTQRASVVQAWPTAVWDQSLWDQSIWGA